MKIRLEFMTNSSSSYYIVRNMTDQEKSQWDLLQSSTDLEYWTDFKQTDMQTAKMKLQHEYFPPFSDTVLQISYTGEPGWGLVAVDDGNFYTQSQDLKVFEPKHDHELVIINSDIELEVFRSEFLIESRIPFNIDSQAEEIHIKATGYEYPAFYCCKLRLNYISRFPNLKRFMYEGENEACSLDVNLEPLTNCQSLEEVHIEGGCNSPLDFTPLLKVNLKKLYYNDLLLDISFSIEGTPEEVNESIHEYQRTFFLKSKA